MELLWQLAGHEAIAAQFREIEPDHFFAALLKFSELPVHELDRLAPRADVARELSNEINAIRQDLQHRMIDSTRVRRNLRSRLGNGSNPYDGGQMHRSQASRNVFDAAGRLADDAESEVLTAVHLLEAILASPTSCIREVLGNAAGSKTSACSNTPLLDRYGKDLAGMAGDGQSADALSREAEGKALCQLLVDSRCRGVLLISDSDEAVRSVVMAVARGIASSEPPPGMEGTRIVDVTDMELDASEEPPVIKRLSELLVEVAGMKDVVLFAPPIKSPSSPDARDPWAELLKKTLANGSTRCIVRASPATYELCIKMHPDWKQHSHIMWVEQTSYDSIPWEL